MKFAQCKIASRNTDLQNPSKMKSPRNTCLQAVDKSDLEWLLGPLRKDTECAVSAGVGGSNRLCTEQSWHVLAEEYYL